MFSPRQTLHGKKCNEMFFICLTYPFMWLSREWPSSNATYRENTELEGGCVRSPSILLFKLVNTRSHNQSEILLDTLAFDPVGPLTFDSLPDRFISGPAEGN